MLCWGAWPRSQSGGQGQAARGPPPHRSTAGLGKSRQLQWNVCSITQKKNPKHRKIEGQESFPLLPSGETAGGHREEFLNAAWSEGFPEPEQCLLTQASALNCQASVLLRADCKLGARNKVSGDEGRG